MKSIPIALEEACSLCPRACSAPRTSKKSVCRADRLKVALAALHPYEEPCLAGAKGAGTVFFSHCNLKCVFCQNHEISHAGAGLEVSVPRLSEIFLELEAAGAATIDLVSPGHYVKEVAQALLLAKARGLALPVVWNSNGYELCESLERLEGLVEVFLPDLKFMDSRASARYCGARDYFERASRAVRRMVEMTGPARFAQGVMTRGVLIRHLVMPGMAQDSMRILDWIRESFADAVWVSIMSQYVPMHRAKDFPEIDRRVFSAEYLKVVRHARAIGLVNAYVQDRSAGSDAYVPVFDGRGVLSE